MWVVVIIVCFVLLSLLCCLCGSVNPKHTIVQSLIRQLAAKTNTQILAIIDSPCSFRSGEDVMVHDSIDLHATTEILAFLRTSHSLKPLDIIIHTEGGEISSAVQIATALARHRAPVRIFVPYYAYSAGTFLCLAAQQILMDPNAVLGCTDAQAMVPTDDGGGYQAAAKDLGTLVDSKSPDAISDAAFLSNEASRKWLQLSPEFIKHLMKRYYPPETISNVIQQMASGDLPHDTPIYPEIAQSMGLNIAIKRLDPEIYAIVDTVIADTCRGRRTTIFST